MWTHEQELDLLELGKRPAACIKGESGATDTAPETLIAGRANRALAEQRRQEFYRQFGKPLWSMSNGELLQEKMRLQGKVAVVTRERNKLRATIKGIRSRG